MRRDHVVVMLAAVSGSVDAIGFVALGGAFSSVMTGNLVICGVALAHGDGQLLLLVAAAVVAYVVGVGLGARIAGAPPPVHVREHWPAAVTQTLLVELGLFAVFAIGWWSAGSHPGEHVQVLLLAVNAMALGMQSAAVTRFGVAGLSSTYLTGTLTTLVLRLVHREPLGEVRLNAQLLLALVAGGAGGAALAFHARAAAPVLPLVLLALALVAARRLHLSRG